ncbi:MAG TPA: ROK family protein [Kofleriaceae bacterium]|nr:ROK family protein [Kofleriaceae bacterium]
MNEREAFLRRFHAARPGITSTALAGRAVLAGREAAAEGGGTGGAADGGSGDSYDRLAAAVPRGSRVLDLGCGDTHLLGLLGPHAIGVDLAPSRGSIDGTSGGAGGAMVVAGRAQALPFADRAFDACVCHLGFMLFDELDAVVGELGRVVVPGGVFAAVLGGGPTAADDGDDAFHRFLALATPRGPSFGDARARSEAGWHALFGSAPSFARFELALDGAFDDVWRFLGASYQLSGDDAPAVRARLAASYAGRAVVPCRVVLWLATVRLSPPAARGQCAILAGRHPGNAMSDTTATTVTAHATAAATTLRTLAIDIGGTGLKALILGPDGTALTERARVPTPRPATPDALLPELWKLIEPLGAFDRVSIGFPGVVVDGVTLTAPNLHKQWQGFDLAKAMTAHLGRPVRVLNDAGVQGYGVIEGHGVELVLTLGTGLGCALYYDGIYVPNLELAHHPFGNGKTYEDYVGAKALKRVGKKKWNRRVAKMIAQVQPVWNPRRLYLGGGNAKHLKIELPSHVTITPNVAGLLGGIVLWRDHVPPARATR